jgi:hypothetical protein
MLMDTILNDLRRMLTGPDLLSLSNPFGSRLVPVLYIVGLVAIVIWAVGLVVGGFALAWSRGIWAIIEMVVYGGFMVLALRAICEALLIYFSAGQARLEAAAATASEATLLDEVRDAIDHLADEDAGTAAKPDKPYVPEDAFGELGNDMPPPAPRPQTRRTARRSPKRSN